MADLQIVTTLRTNQAELHDAIDYLEGKLSEARSDLGHVNAVLRLYEVDGTRHQPHAPSAHLAQAASDHPSNDKGETINCATA